MVMRLSPDPWNRHKPLIGQATKILAGHRQERAVRRLYVVLANGQPNKQADKRLDNMLVG